MTKIVEPNITLDAFSCPICGTYTTQYWYKPMPSRLNKGEEKMVVGKGGRFYEYRDYLLELHQEEPVKFKSAKKKLDDCESYLSTNKVFFSELFTDNESGRKRVIMNLHLSQCYECGEMSVWLSNKLIHPRHTINIKPNEDLNGDIKIDFEEAKNIVNDSPRGAAALLRLCNQKLCIQLKLLGKNINADIKTLHEKSLDDRIKKALDLVRVIGNEAVHPGELDLKDDRDTALKLFDLVNFIAYEMITKKRNKRNKRIL